jgi:UDP-glucose 4-epimerase
VHVVDNFSTGRRENLSSAATVHEHDIREPLVSLFAGIAPEVVLHLAAQADVGTSVERPVFDAEVNVLGTLNVLEAARAHRAQVVFSSTGGAIYGDVERPAREDDPRRPVSPYGTSKLAAEEYLATWNALHGTTHVVLRFANVYGPRQLPKLEGGVVSIFLDRLRSGEGITIYGDGGQTRDFVYVGDVVAAVLAGIGHDGGVFNIGTGTETSVNELFDACRQIAGGELEAQHAPARPGDALRSVLDVSRAERELGWRPQTPLAEGLRLSWG